MGGASTAPSEALGHFDELIKGGAPTLVEAHLRVRGLRLGRAVYGHGPVSRPRAGRLHRDDGGKGKVSRDGTEAGTHRVGPHEAPVLDDLEDASRTGVEGLAVG